MADEHGKANPELSGQGGVEKEEIGRDESWFANVKELFDIWMANIKRTYDEYQQVSLEGIKNQQKYQEKVLSDAQQYDNARQALANLSLADAIKAQQNATETANMAAKQAIRHGDIAIDRQWNVDEVSTLTAKSGVEADIVAASAALASAIAAMAAAKASEAK